MTEIQRIYLAITTVVLPLAMHAWERVKVDNLYFGIEGDLTAEVIDGTLMSNRFANQAAIEQYKNANRNYAVGRVEIPSIIKYNGIQYTVTRVAQSAFFGSGITDVVIPETVKEIGPGAFKESRLQSVTFKNPSVKLDDGSVFAGCKYLTEISLPYGLKRIPDYCFAESGLHSIQIPHTVTEIGYNAFMNCKQLQSLTLPPNLRKVSDAMCMGCTSLKSVSIPWGVTTIGTSSFLQCTSLSSINIPESVKTIELNAFADCKSLPKLTIPTDVTIGQNAFKGTKNDSKTTKTTKTSTSSKSKTTPAKNPSTKKRTSIYD